MYTVELNDITLQLETVPAIFSPQAADAGTRAMLEETEFRPDDKVLDLGCGCGIVGIYAAKLLGEERVVLCDIDEQAVRLARINSEQNGVGGVSVRLSDGYENIPETDFSLILSNPPYHADFSVARHFIEGGFRRLRPGGRLLMVTKRLDWYKNKLISVFGGVRIVRRDGYYVFIAEKRAAAPPRKKKVPAPAMSRKLRRRHRS